MQSLSKLSAKLSKQQVLGSLDLLVAETCCELRLNVIIQAYICAEYFPFLISTMPLRFMVYPFDLPFLNQHLVAIPISGCKLKDYEPGPI